MCGLLYDSMMSVVREPPAYVRGTSILFKWQPKCAMSLIGPETEVPQCPRFGRDRVESGHNSQIAQVKRLMLLRKGRTPPG